MTTPSGLEAIVFDLDGVIRHYDRAHEREIEQRWGLATGSLISTAFGGELGHSFMVGQIDHRGFELGLAELLGSDGAAAEFVAMRAEVDHEAVEIVRHAQGLLPVALLTNGSVRTREELDESGLHDAFDHIFNSAETGVPKPHARAYLNVLDVLGAPPAATAFVDDHEPNIVGAEQVGMRGHLYVGIEELRGFLRGNGIAAP